VTKSNKAANDLADFYGCEDFMQVFCAFAAREADAGASKLEVREMVLVCNDTRALLTEELHV